jgi:hypothetical protein
MPITDLKFKRLTPENVARAPKKPGVFALYDKKDTLVFLGLAAGPDDTIRSVMKAHVARSKGTDSQGATRYKREATGEAEARFESLLAEFKAANKGGLPSGNSSP